MPVFVVGFVAMIVAVIVKAITMVMVNAAVASHAVLPGCNNFFAFMIISKTLFHCISSLPSSHPSYPRA